MVSVIADYETCEACGYDHSYEYAEAVKAHALHAVEVAERTIDRATAPAVDSARVALVDAIACFERGDHRNAQRRALHSVAYSVGVFDPAYQLLKEEVEV